MNNAASGYTSDVGLKVVKICDDEGVFKKMGYGLSWLGVKIAKLISDDYDNLSPEMEELIIKRLTWGPDTSKWAR